MTKFLKKMMIGAALIPFAQCSLIAASPSAVAQTAPSAPATVTDDADPALWVVKDEDTTIYLFGTVHMLKPGLGWFDEAVKTAFDKSDTLVLEVIMPEDPSEVAAKTIPLAIDQTGKSLSSQLTDEQRVAYEAAMSKFNLPVGQFDVFEPWFPAITLGAVALMTEGYDPEHGSEKTLTAAAKAAAKPVKALETLDEQMGFFDGLAREDQLRYLNDVVEQMPNANSEFAELIFAWARGNPDELGVRMNRAMSGSEALAERLLFQRNDRWAEWIKGRLAEPGTIFMAVGAGHLAGPKSVQDYLTARGLRAERVAY